MTADENTADQAVPKARRRSPGRQQRAKGGRKHRTDVKMSDEEAIQIQARAISLGVSVPRLLVESALHGDPATVSERHARHRELTALRRQVAGYLSNVNQLTRIGNATGELPPEIPAALRISTRVLERLDDLLATMTPPPDRSKAAAEDVDEGGDE
ncbi:hypothetical protein [Streptomyces sp. NPDC002078]